MIAEVRIAIAEIYRILAKGGIAFVTVAGRKDQEMAYEEIEPGTYVPLVGSEKGLPHHIFTEEEVQREFRAFQIQEISHRAEGNVLALWVVK